jgi:hypothetical protein
MTARASDIARALVVLTGAVAQVVMGALPFIQDWANTVGSRSAEVQVLLTPAGYAFSIWSVLFLGCGIYALVHLVRLTEPVMRATGWLAGLAFWFNTAWETWVPFYGIEIVSLGLIMAGWLACVAFMLTGSAQREIGMLHRAVRLPVYALGGWLNAAAFVNVLIVAEVYGLPWLGSGAVAPAIAVLALALIAAVIVVLRTGSGSYAAALGWGLLGIWAANDMRNEPVLIGQAALLAIAVVLVSLLAGWAGRVFQASSTSFRPR